ncbi:MAG: hypothetical protein ACUVRG_09580 [Ignavibacterium sp.]
MNEICPIIYQLCDNEKYSYDGLKLLSKKLTMLIDLPLSQEE